MANIARAVVSSFVDRLGDQINREVSSLLGIREQLEWVESQFKWMKAFLKDAEAKSDKDERAKHWMREVEEVAYLAEDIIDTFFLEVEPLSQQGFSGAFHRINAGRKLISEIERMKKQVDSISESRAAYGIEDTRREEGTSTAVQSCRVRRLPSPHVEEPDFVGFRTDLEKLMGQLTKGKPRRSVISIVGMGGLGKTTLARKIYQSDVVRRHFHPCVWISISQEYGVVELLQAFMKKCMGMRTSAENMDADELREKIAGYLTGKRYLVILDDIWTHRAWDDLKDAFPRVSNGSRVLLTTRNKEVALYADARSEPHGLRFLDEEESWELFLKKAFLGGEAHFLIDSQLLRKEIWSKCQGLPLAIVVIGGLLSRRKEPREWQNILNSISWQLIKGPEQISDILSLSYTDLPYFLKTCFLYLGVFPEDYEIPAKNLIQLWVAEGFIQERGFLTLEEAGEECLRELIQRSLVQLGAKSSNGAIKTCRIHDLLRDFALSKVENDAFLEVQSSAAVSKPCKGRRLVVHHRRYDFLNPRSPNLRSLLIHSQDSVRILDEDKSKLIFRSFKFLRVLDIQRELIEDIPREVGELIHLRYFGCRVGSGKIPPNVGNLVNLQTLRISSASNFPIRIPITIFLKMQQLRHVQAGGNYGRIRIEGDPCVEQLWKNNNLQTLKNVVACEWMNDGCLGRLTMLRKLGIDVSPMQNRPMVETIWESIMRLESLESLYVTALPRSHFGSESLGPVPPFNLLPKLCKLNLKGKLEDPAVLNELPRNLTKLILEESCLEQDPLPILEKLENLRILSLDRCSYTIEKMKCSARGFPRLQFLKIAGLPVLREWRVEIGSMPCLLHLFISRCYNLKEVPDLQHAATLKKFETLDMSPEFKDKIKEDTGDDWYKIQHVSSIVLQ